MTEIDSESAAGDRCLFDTHAHLCDPAFDGDRGEVLERARDAGVESIIAVGETLQDARANLALAHDYPWIIRPAAGLFPTILDLDQAESLAQWIRRHVEDLIAIGEVGLDHWKVEEPEDREIQRQVFERFVELAMELDLPLNVHSRSAGAPAIELLLQCGARRVQLHAFDGRAAKAQPAIEAGFFLSVPPSVVRSRQKQKLVRQVPLQNLLLETDSPVLGREPGERNEPANLGLSLQAVAELKGVHREAVVEAVRDNSLRLYGEALLGGARHRSESTSGN
ncbi:MAG: TatD family hydrolase [Thermoanaerobaculia bacterium]